MWVVCSMCNTIRVGERKRELLIKRFSLLPHTQLLLRQVLRSQNVLELLSVVFHNKRKKKKQNNIEQNRSTTSTRWLENLQVNTQHNYNRYFDEEFILI